MGKALLGIPITVAVTGSFLVAPVNAHAERVAPAATQITKFGLTTNEWGDLWVNGQVSATGATVPAGLPLAFEYSVNGKTGWKKLPPAKGYTPAKTQNGGAFTGKYRVWYEHTYYRARFAGNSALGSSVSGNVLDKRINAVIFNLKITPTKVRKGRYVTFSGILKEKPGATWKPYKGRQIWILGRVKGESKFYWYAKPKTNSKGKFSIRFKPSADTYWLPVYYGDKTHYVDIPRNGKPIFVDVR